MNAPQVNRIFQPLSQNPKIQKIIYLEMIFL